MDRLLAIPPPPHPNQPNPELAEAIEAQPYMQQPILQQHDGPYKKSSVLTLDGGGVRGYASLWILQILMDAIKKLEEEHDDPHYSSFAPSASQASLPSGPVIHTQSEELNNQGPPPRASTVNSDGPRSSIFRRRTTNISQQPNGTSREDTRFLPCHYFDYIGGTSTGGLNAIMLGRLRMSVESCLERYPEMAENVFSGKKRRLITRVLKGTSSKYDSNLLKNEIDKIVKAKIPPNSGREALPLSGGYDFERYHYHNDLCRTIVVTNEYNGIADTPYLFRSYDHYGSPDEVKNPGPAHRHEIWQIARATAAAPTFFSPITIGDHEYSDGGIGNNNPVSLILEEVAAKAQTKYYPRAVSTVVSVGTGLKPSKTLRVKHKLGVSSLRPVRAINKILDRLKNASTDSERAHEHIQALFNQLNFNHYYRWNGGEAVGGIAMDEWRSNQKRNNPPTARFIEQEVKKYMLQDTVRARVEECARELVKQRRQRLAHQPEDGVFQRRTHCTTLRCPYCDHSSEDRRNLKHHIIHVHPENITNDINIDTLVQQIKERSPRYPGGPF